MHENEDVKKIVEATTKQEQQELYQKYVKKVTPANNSSRNVARAFWVGGAICVLGQILQNAIMSMDVEKRDAGLYTTIILVLLSVLFTGFGLYPKMAKYGGAGTIVPITGFANSVAAAATEYKVQGQVFGIGCFIFSIAGPVILYGIFSSFLLGVVYWLIGLL